MHVMQVLVALNTNDIQQKKKTHVLRGKNSHNLGKQTNKQYQEADWDLRKKKKKKC